MVFRVIIKAPEAVRQKTSFPPILCDRHPAATAKEDIDLRIVILILHNQEFNLFFCRVKCKMLETDTEYPKADIYKRSRLCYNDWKTSETQTAEQKMKYLLEAGRLTETSIFSLNG